MKTFHHPARSLALPALLVCLGLVAACGGKQDSTPAAGQTTADAARPAPHDPHAGHDHPAAAGDVVLAGVVVTPPAAWQDLGPNGMRQAQFRLPAVAGDADAAEVNVFYFGPASGGGVEANLQRWIGQMTVADGVQPTRSTFSADGMNGHLVELDGTYNSGGMRPMGGAGEAKAGYRLVGVVLEGPQGSLFFKLTGPVATAKVMQDELLAMVKGARKAG
ncbi:MAG: hypothetical protein R3D98_03690 [Candidatus Krumholzibacteriia bacterium]